MDCGSKTTFLHDGRAATIEQASPLHGGEATAARDRFSRLSAGARKRAARVPESL